MAKRTKSGSNTVVNKVAKITEEETIKASVLLVGSAGNGKSTLGNYLLDPYETIKKPEFETAPDNLPKTQNSRSVTRTIHTRGDNSRVELTVIDTPGLNESAVKDLKHMVELISELQSIGEISACIFVVKFRSIIDKQYKETIQYYAKLLPGLFEKNVFVVMTNYQTNPNAIKSRKKEGIDEEQMQRNVVRTMVEYADLSYDDPLVFKIDCRPVTDEDEEASLNTCFSIFNYVLSLQPIKMRNLRVAKTDYLLALDNAEINKHESVITGYQERMEKVTKDADELFTKIQKKEGLVSSLEANVDSINRNLGEKDTEELVTAATWSIDQKWKCCKAQETRYVVKSQWTIENVRKWTNTKCEFKDEFQTTKILKGKVIGKFMHDLYANITLETKKCTKYEGDIRILKEKLQQAMEEYIQEKAVLSSYSGMHEKHCIEVKELKSYIEEKRKLIVQLSNDRMTIEEAYRRLKEISPLVT